MQWRGFYPDSLTTWTTEAAWKALLLGSIAPVKSISLDYYGCQKWPQKARKTEAKVPEAKGAGGKEEHVTMFM